MKHPAISKMGDQYFIGCAHCGGDFMHQTDVEVFRRDREDSPTGLHAWTRGVEFVTSKSMEGNPGVRRDAVILSFWCEQCDCTTVLEIVQIKGAEVVDVRVEEPVEALEPASSERNPSC